MLSSATRDEVEESLGKHTDLTFPTDFRHEFSYDIEQFGRVVLPGNSRIRRGIAYIVPHARKFALLHPERNQMFNQNAGGVRACHHPCLRLHGGTRLRHPCC